MSPRNAAEAALGEYLVHAAYELAQQTLRATGPNGLLDLAWTLAPRAVETTGRLRRLRSGLRALCDVWAYDPREVAFDLARERDAAGEVLGPRDELLLAQLLITTVVKEATQVAGDEEDREAQARLLWAADAVRTAFSPDAARLDDDPYAVVATPGGTEARRLVLDAVAAAFRAHETDAELGLYVVKPGAPAGKEAP